MHSKQIHPEIIECLIIINGYKQKSGAMLMQADPHSADSGQLLLPKLLLLNIDGDEYLMQVIILCFTFIFNLDTCVQDLFLWEVHLLVDDYQEISSTAI